MAANSLPIPIPPRTPTPPSDDPPPFDDHHHIHTASDPAGLGFDIVDDEHDYHDIGPYAYRTHSNGSESAAPNMGRNGLLSPASASLSPAAGGLSPQSLYSPATPQTGGIDGSFQSIDGAGGAVRSAAAEARNPFNFTTQQYVAGRTGSLGKAGGAEVIGKRRGHKYRHSSIHTSHQIFQPPVQRTPLAVPSSLPMPTRNEAWNSFTQNQTLRLLWCVCHFLVAGYVQFSGSGSLAMMALSRLLLFDAAGAAVSVVVDVMGNFEVWKRSSIKHPFGLERADVLAGFGLAVFISFMGLDIISHGIQHSLENLGSHEAHSPHSHRRVSPGTVDLDALISIASTLVSAFLLKNHARIGKAMRVQFLPASWGRILSNPSHLLTLSTSILLLLLPLLSIETYSWFDAAFAFTVAVLMLAFGARLGMSLASMLLMSYNPRHDKKAVREVIEEMETDPAISAVEEARFWQVHYGLCMANIKVRYWGNGGYGEDVVKLRQRITSLVRNRLGGGYGSGSSGARWDVSVQMAVEKD
ncbi:hypothetical protein K431DRAFT_282019 [Polychaeton citri CBS 116435]|uniref:Zinc transporter n=1 Tax=Polychaeton citri CBS 116435 TaxID=1314669 RepID=A0A9P4US35_9PEZI|nr:hypothetical protein K431DRAFT_282019 [Polychaeton citri CBS 116435]